MSKDTIPFKISKRHRNKIIWHKIIHDKEWHSLWICACCLFCFFCVLCIYPSFYHLVKGKYIPYSILQWVYLFSVTFLILAIVLVHILYEKASWDILFKYREKIWIEGLFLNHFYHELSENGNRMNPYKKDAVLYQYYIPSMSNIVYDHQGKTLSFVSDGKISCCVSGKIKNLSDTERFYQRFQIVYDYCKPSLFHTFLDINLPMKEENQKTSSKK